MEDTKKDGLTSPEGAGELPERQIPEDAAAELTDAKPSRMKSLLIACAVVAACLLAGSVFCMVQATAALDSAAEMAQKANAAYDCERQGWEFVAEANEALLAARSAGASSDQAIEDIAAGSPQAEAGADGTLHAVFESEESQKLDVVLKPADDGTVEVVSWKLEM